MALKTNYKDDVLNATMNGKRRYRKTDYSDGTFSLEDVTTYDQVGDDFAAKDVNEINKEVNTKFDSGDVVDPMLATEGGFAADALATKKQFDEQNEKITNLDNGIKMEKVLLWTNPSPTKAFASQTLKIDYSQFKRIIIEAAYNNTTGTSSSAKNFEWFTDSIQNKVFIQFLSMYGSFNGREVTFQNREISFSKAQAGTTHTDPFTEENNNVAIPLRIFGCYY